MINYEFRLDFLKKDTLEKIYEVQCLTNGISFSGSINTSWMPSSAVAYKTGTVQLVNMGFSFIKKLSWGDTCTIYYRTNWQKDINKWRFVYSGAIAMPEDADADLDYQVNLTLHQVNQDNFYGKLLEKNFQDKTIIQALTEVLGDKIGLISISETTQNKVILGSFYCKTVLDFLKRIQEYGGFAIKTDFGDFNPANPFSQIFFVEERTEFSKRFSRANVKVLGHYAISGIPQVSLEKNDAVNTYLQYWTAKTLFTAALKVGDSVSFRDRENNEVLGVIEDISYQFSNIGECTTTMKINDFSNAGKSR